jgi:hypothetical protein
MKRSYLKIAALALLVTFSNCSKDEAEPVNTTPVEVIPAMTDDEIQSDILSDLALDEASDVVYGLLQKGAAGKSTANAVTNGCTPTKTQGFEKVGDITYASISYDYGTDGCLQPNGKTVKGKIKLLSSDFDFTKVIVSFTNYYSDDVVINGSITLEKLAVGTYQSVVKNTQDVTVTLPKIGDFKRVGTITRSFIKGFDKPDDASDDVFETTGNWTTTFPDKSTNVVTITTPILTKIECPKKRIKGIVEFNRKGNKASLNLGDGQTCAQDWKITRAGKQPFTVTQ